MVNKKTRLILNCAVCGIAVERLECQIKNYKKVYCSKACVGVSKRHGSTLYCEFCDSPFYRRFGEQDLGVRINNFCSRACLTEWRLLNKKEKTYLKQGARHIHRIVAESVLQRPLRIGETVHHRDLNRDNNHFSNLVVFPSQALHARCHFGKMSQDELNSYSLMRIAEGEKSNLTLL